MGLLVEETAALNSGECVQRLQNPLLPTQVVTGSSAQRLKFQRPLLDSLQSSQPQVLGPFAFSISVASQCSEMLAFTKRPRKGRTRAKALVVALAQGAAAGAGREQQPPGPRSAQTPVQHQQVGFYSSSRRFSVPVTSTHDLKNLWVYP